MKEEKIKNENSNHASDFGKEETDDHAIVSIIGVGHNGCHAVHNLYWKNMYTSLAVCDAYQESLDCSPVERKVLMGKGAHAISSQNLDKILIRHEWIKIILVHLDNNISIQGACQIASASREKSKETIVIVSMPSQLEGAERMEMARKGYETLKNAADTILTVNEPPTSLSVSEYFQTIEREMQEFASCMVRMITIHNILCFDLSDFIFITKCHRESFLGTGYSAGALDVSDAMNNAIMSIERNGLIFSNAKHILIFITYNDGKGFEKSNDQVGDNINALLDRCDKLVESMYGILVDQSLGNRVRVELIIN
jgi:cell division GTPase FtsZ